MDSSVKYSRPSENRIEAELFNKDPMAWSRALVSHYCGQFSMAAVQANMDIEDHSQVDVGTDALFVGVYDGHKGDTASIYLRNHIFKNLLRLIQQNGNNMHELCMKQLVEEMEIAFIEFARKCFEEQHQVQNSFVSSGCLISIIWKGTLYVANVGDSRAVLGSRKGIAGFKGLSVKQMVRDHSLKNPDIQKEFTDLNPSCYQSIEAKDLIETSRCIGYAYMKKAPFTEGRSFEIPLSEAVTPAFTRPLLSPQPEVYSRVLKDSDRFIIFGSGGFWKLMSNEDAAKVVDTSPKYGIAERLAVLALEKAACKRGKRYGDLIAIPKSNRVSGNNGNRYPGFRSAYHDDITVIVVYLDKKLIKEGLRPVINCYRGYDETVRQSEFTNFYNNDVDPSSARFLMSANRYLGMFVPHSSRKKAILVGIENSNTRSIGSYADVFAMRTMLMDVYHMSSEDIIVLLDYLYFHWSRNASLRNVCENVFRSFQDCNNVDDVLLYFASHGQRRVSCPLSNNTCYNEQVLLANGTLITDDDLREIAKLAPVHFTVISDTCHSGGLVEGSYEQVGTSTFRPVPGGIEERALQQRVQGRDLGLCMTAAQSSQPAISNTFYIGGAFTNTLIDTVYRRRGHISPRQIINSVTNVFERTVIGHDSGSGLPVFLGDIQRPGLYGSDYNCDRLFLGGPALN